MERRGRKDTNARGSILRTKRTQLGISLRDAAEGLIKRAGQKYDWNVNVLYRRLSGHETGCYRDKNVVDEYSDFLKLPRREAWQDVLRIYRDRHKADLALPMAGPVATSMQGRSFDLPTPAAKVPTAFSNGPRETEHSYEEISGQAEIWKASIRLVEQALNDSKRSRNDKEIFICQSGRSGDGANRDSWTEVLHRALIEKWSITQLWRMSDTLDNLNIVNNVLTFAPFKSYESRYFKDYSDAVESSYDLLFIPDVGALVCFPGHNPEQVDTGIYFSKHPPAGLGQYCELLRSERASSSLAQFYPRDKRAEIEWTQQIAALEAEPGERLLVQHQLTSLARPRHHYNQGSEWYKRQCSKIGEARAQELAQVRVRRLDTFLRAPKTHEYRFRQICSQSAVPEWSRGRRQEYVEFMENAVNLLKSNDNFDLRVSDIGGEGAEHRAHWYVQANSTVLMEISYKRPHGLRGSRYANIRERVCALQFRKQFDSLWSRATIKPKSAVTQWLTDQITKIKA